MTQITLERDGMRLVVSPGRGATIESLETCRNGRSHPILAPRRGDPADPTTAACFPMLPWCDRLSAGGVATQDGLRPIAANWPTTLFPVHGIGWLSAWSMAVCDAGTARLTMAHEGPVYRFEAWMDFELLGGAATMSLGLRNCGKVDLPFGIGLHPYFPRDATTRVILPAERITTFDRSGLPERTVPSDTMHHLDGTLPLEDANAVYDATGPVEIMHAGEAVEMRCHGFPHIHVYAPPGAEFVAIEPLSHPVDAFSTQAGALAHLLAPGGEMEGSMTLRSI